MYITKYVWDARQISSSSKLPPRRIIKWRLSDTEQFAVTAKIWCVFSQHIMQYWTAKNRLCNLEEVWTQEILSYNSVFAKYVNIESWNHILLNSPNYPATRLLVASAKFPNYDWWLFIKSNNNRETRLLSVITVV